MKFIALLLGSLLVSCQTGNSKTYDLIISKGKVIHLETGKVEEQDIFVSDGRIRKITAPGVLDRDVAKQQIDAAGKYILPGFWDNHVHFRGGDSLLTANENFLNLFLANGITTVRDAGGDLTPSVMKWREEISAGKLNGPVIFTSGPKIDGVGGTWAGSLEVEDEEEITLALDSLQSIGTDYVKLYDSKISGDLYLKTIEQAERRGLITSGHMPFTVQLEETIAAGIDGIEHLYYIMKGCSSLESEITVKLSNDEIGFWDAMPLLQQTYEDSTAQKTFRRLKDSKVFVVPTLHIGKTLSYLDEVDHDDDPYLKYMGAGIIETYQGRIDAARKATPQTILNRKKLDTFFGELTESLSDAGVKLLAGSDSGAYNSYTYPGISLHKELEALVACGLSPLEALRASAYNGSLFLKQEADYGTVVEGKISDLVLLNANPLQDIANTKNIYLVLQGQKIYTSEELNNFLKEVIVN